jgi:type 2 lantibiotic biosynthesis protein LanM
VNDSVQAQIGRFEREDVRRLTRQTRSLLESLDASSLPSETTPADVIDEWTDAVSPGEDSTLSTRLATLGSDERTVRAALEGDTEEALQCVEETPEPDWIEDIGAHTDDDWIVALDMLLSNTEEVGPSDPAAVDPTRDRPFGDVVSAIVSVVSDRVSQSLHDNQTYQPDAVEALEEWLADRVAATIQQPLFIEFQLFQARRDDASPTDWSTEGDDSPPTAAYRAFVADLFSGRLGDVFLEYPLSGLQLVQMAEHWQSAVREFLDRVATDRAELQARFDVSLDATVTSIEVGGDPHEDGRRVLVLHFSDDTSVVYKPRDLGAESAFFEFVAYVNRESELPTHETLTVWNKAEYGWMEHVEPEACHSPNGVKRYYRRVGNLVTLLHTLNFVDGHVENVIARGEYPVPIDLETIMQPTVSTDRSLSKQSSVSDVRSCLLRTGLLPVVSPGADVSGVAAFDGTAGYVEGLRKPRFTATNSGEMEMSYEHRRPVEGQSLPTLDGDETDPQCHYESLRRGYEEAYDFLCDHREELLNPEGPLTVFEDVQIRFLCRSTNEYTRTLDLLRTPAALRSGVAFDLQIESLYSALADDDTHGSLPTIYHAERRALWQSDVPRFTVQSDETELQFRGRPLCSYLETTPVESIRENVEQLSPRHRRRGSHLLTLAFAPDCPTRPVQFRGLTLPDTVEETHDIHYGGELERIEDRVVEAKYDVDGTDTWISWESRDKGAYVSGIPDDLYEGRLGLGVYAAALHARTDSQDHESYLDGVLAPVVERVHAGQLDEERIGIGHGLGSLVYGLTVAGDLAEEPQYASAARDVVDQIGEEDIEADSYHDVMGGNAGLVLALLALYDRTGDQSLIDTAVRAGDRLLSVAVDRDEGIGWYTVDESRILTGMSHGNAGIAYALARLASETGAGRFESGARSAIAYEQTLYDEARKNWPDLRPSTDDEYGEGWCGGRSGGVLSRFATGRELSDHELRDSALHCLDSDASSELIPRDTLCCGNAGRISAFVEIGCNAGRTSHRDRAARLADKMVQRSRQLGTYVLPYQTEQRYFPSLFLGEPGIGYSLLRVENPDLPCLLLFE